MDIKTFKVERWMNEYENDCTYNLAETCIDSLTVRELTEMAGLDTAEFMNELADTRMTYGHIFGSPELLEGIAGLYGELVKPEHVIPMHGAIGANNHVIMALIDPSDNMVSVMPTYQQHYSIPESIGAEVRILNLNLENHFLPDIDLLKSLVDDNTRMITINSWLPKLRRHRGISWISIAQTVLKLGLFYLSAGCVNMHPSSPWD